jgi:acyl-CoA synthetase (NDP forming)
MRFLSTDDIPIPKQRDEIESLLERALSMPEGMLPEHETYRLLELIGVSVPKYMFHEISDLSELVVGELPHEGPFVAKAVISGVAHKTELNALRFDIMRDDATEVVIDFEKQFADTPDYLGVVFVEQIKHDPTLAGEILLGMFQDPFFGPCVALGFGGTRTEHYKEIMPPNKSTVMIPAAIDIDSIDHMLRKMPVVELVEGKIRGASEQLTHEELLSTIRAFKRLARFYSPTNPESDYVIEELEINPAVVSNHEMIALDGVLRVRRNDKPVSQHKPIEKVFNLLSPKSVAIVGASGKNPANPANIILRKFIDSEMADENIYVVHPKENSVEGIPCVPNLEALLKKRGGEPVDCLVVGVPAKIAGMVIADSFDRYAAHSLEIISSGFGETAAGKSMQDDLSAKLAALDKTPDRRPVINGPNTLGNTYHGINTLFTPNYKSSGTGVGKKNVAIICQSGAFMITRISDMADVIAPDVAISVGNQMDLSVVDFLEALLDDDRISTYGLYIEGLNPGDGIRLMELTQRAAAMGKFVIIYKTGRTEAGMEAAKGHTAAMAGDYDMFSHLAFRSGALVAETSEDYQNLVLLTSYCQNLAELRNLPEGKLGVAALSNAGFEKCALADHPFEKKSMTFELANFTDDTRAKLKEILTELGVSGILDQFDVLDLSPMTGDDGFERIVRTVLADKNVHVGVFSIVPETVMLNTCEKGEGHNDDMMSDGSILNRLIRIHDEIDKPFVVSMESGWKYDAFRTALLAAGIPCYRHADDAARAVATCLDTIRRDVF